MQLDRRAFVGGERFSETWPFTGVKGELLEGGIRMPLLAMTGGNGATAGTFDGLDLSAQLTGRAAPVDRTIYGRFKANGQAALRQGNWKHLKLGDKEHLFDLASDARTCRSRARRIPRGSRPCACNGMRGTARCSPIRSEAIARMCVPIMRTDIRP